MCGVSVRMMSVCSVVFWLCANSRPTQRDVAQPGNAVERPALVVANQAGQHVGFAVAQPDDVLISRLPNVGRPPKPVPEMLVTADLQRQRHVVVVVRARRDVDVDADVLVVERRDRLLRRAAGRDRRERRDRHRHLLAESRLRRRCLPRCAAAGWPACACWCRSSAAGSRAPAGRRSSTSDCVRLRSACRRERSGGVGRRSTRVPSMPVGEFRATRSAARIPAAACDRLRAARRR